MGFVYQHPQTGTEFVHVDLTTLERQVKQFYLANNYPIGLQFQQEFEDNLCSNLVDSSLHCAPIGSQGVAPRKLTVNEVKNFLLTATAWVKNGMHFVEPELAEKRSKVCSHCPMNIRVENCSACSGVVSLLSGILGGRHTSQDSKLNSCGICLCSLKAAVHIPLETKMKYMTPEMIEACPEYCWIKKEFAESQK